MGMTPLAAAGALDASVNFAFSEAGRECEGLKQPDGQGRLVPAPPSGKFS
jgi:hypothetical protein